MALPDKIATSKLDSYAWQDEYRLVFSLTDAFGVRESYHPPGKGQTARITKARRHHEYLVKTQNLRDICRLREF